MREKSDKSHKSCQNAPTILKIDLQILSFYVCLKKSIDNFIYDSHFNLPSHPLEPQCVCVFTIYADFYRFRKCFNFLPNTSFDIRLYFCINMPNKFFMQRDTRLGYHKISIFTDIMLNLWSEAGCQILFTIVKNIPKLRCHVVYAALRNALRKF